VVLSGPWNTPQLAINKTQAVAAALKEADPTHAEQYDQNAQNLEPEFGELAQNLKQKALERNTGEVKVLCMEWQKGFVSFLGFNIAKTYSSENTLSIKDVNDLIQSGKDQGALLVIDNLQSGTQTGEQIAQEIGAEQVVLTSFPGAVPGTDSLLEMLKYNGEKLLDAA
jgi:ABC-type Zn uptake system ZnuABC Zn-binding protein ZnuA